MALLDIISITTAVAVVVPIARQLLEYFGYRKNRRSIETSLRLRDVVHKSAVRLASIERREKSRRRILVTPSDLDSPESIRRVYELLLEKDLSEEHEQIVHLLSKLPSQHSALDNFEATIEVKRRTTAWKIINAGLIRAALASRLSDPGTDVLGGSSILGLMLGRRMEVYARAYGCSLAALLAGLLLHTLFDEEGVTYLSIIVPLIILVGLTINQKLLEFRVARGYFGSTASEAIEFIQFIKAHSDKSDFNDGDRMRSIMPEHGRDESEKVVFVGRGAPT